MSLQNSVVKCRCIIVLLPRYNIVTMSLLQYMSLSFYYFKSKKPDYCSFLVENLSKAKRKGGQGIFGVRMTLKVKYNDVFLKKSVLEKEKEKKKEGVNVPEKEDEKSMNN